MFGGSVLNQERIKQALSRYPKNPLLSFTYGTAGFRMKETLLDCIMVRLGILSVLRSIHLKGKTVGIMITASHNPEEDNGVKVVDPTGDMLDPEWEAHAVELVNLNNDLVLGFLSKLIGQYQLDLSVDGKVVFARDTRPSGQRLVRCLVDGIQSAYGKFVDYGEMTTPQLHYIVKCSNDSSYGQPTEKGYYEKFAKAYLKITEGTKAREILYIDCANGVGALKMKLLAEQIGKEKLPVELVNISIREKGVLNHQCGADYVKVEQKVPKGISEQMEKGVCASFDGDADRLVYYYKRNGQFVLLDGDKMAALAAGYLASLLKQLPELSDIKIGVVQTAYANGSSTEYFIEQGIEVAFTQTGVKHLHHKAQEFGIGVYFEANGHGTVLFHPNTIASFKKLSGSNLKTEQKKTLEKLLSLVDLINQTVGDALSDLLLVEAILANRQWSVEQWHQLYQDYPNRQLKVKVENRLAFKTEDADRKLIEPAGIQAQIDELVKNVPSGRSFVRPSGTEDVVRIYAEAESQKDCDELAYKVAQLVFDQAGGVGTRPEQP